MLAAGVVAVLVSREVSGQSSQVIPQTVQELAERAASGAWDTFTAQVTVRRQLVRADGQAAGLAATVEDFIWRRAKTGAGWKTTMTVVEGQRPGVRVRTGLVTVPTTPTVARVEDQEDGSPLRFFNRDGVEIAMPPASLRDRFRRPDAPGLDPALVEQVMSGPPGPRPARGQAWIGALVMSAATRTDRLRAFDRRFGRRAGTVRGLSQYVHEEGSGRREVLVDDQNGVPVEASLVQGGALVSRSAFAYEQAPSGAIVRRGVRLERALSMRAATAAMPGMFRDAAQRVVIEVSYSNIRLDQKGGR